MCWESEIDTRPVRDRDEELSLLKSELKRLEEAKQEIEAKIPVQWMKIEKICGHPKVKVQDHSWRQAICMTCGRSDHAWYFKSLRSLLIGADGQDVEEKERKDRERRKQILGSGEERGK